MGPHVELTFNVQHRYVAALRSPDYREPDGRLTYEAAYAAGQLAQQYVGVQGAGVVIESIRFRFVDDAAATNATPNRF